MLVDELKAKLISVDAARALATDGYFVLDNAIPHETATAYQAEIESCYNLGLMKPNQVRFVAQLASNKVCTVTKPHIYELDLHDSIIRQNLKQFDRFFHEDSAALLQALESVDVLPNKPFKHGPSGQAIKLQYNEGNGGCFPLHYDNPSRPNKRVLTCILYLNKHFTTGDGGELCLVPFLKKPVVLEPLFNRLVVFKSDLILHRVLPSHKPRYCFSIWYDAADAQYVNTDEEVNLKLTRELLQDVDLLIQYLRNSPVQRLLSRCVYEEEYKASLVECMQHSQDQQWEQMLLSHQDHIRKTAQNKALQNLIDVLRQFKE